MPRRLYKLNDFSGGLNTVKDVADINDNEVSVGREPYVQCVWWYATSIYYDRLYQ